MNILGHFKTITYHKIVVMKHCFKVGLYKQGLLHDMSKYSPTEFFPGVKFYQGNRSPNNAEREATGYSMAWLHHKGRNKHHFEYWTDYSIYEKTSFAGQKMPLKYVIEMFCDRVAASKVYNGVKYKNSDPYTYFVKGKDHYLIHQETSDLLESLLVMLKDSGEDKTFKYIKDVILKKNDY